MSISLSPDGTQGLAFLLEEVSSPRTQVTKTLPTITAEKLGEVSVLVSETNENRFLNFSPLSDANRGKNFTHQMY